jgi:hypothetical protein
MPLLQRPFEQMLPSAMSREAEKQLTRLPRLGLSLCPKSFIRPAIH